MSSLLDKPLPHNEKSEIRFISSLLTDECRESIPKYSELVLPKYFYNPKCKIAYEILLKMQSAGEEISLVTFDNQLRRTNVNGFQHNDIFDLFCDGNVTVNPQHDALEIQFLHKKRRAIIQVQRLLNTLNDTSVDPDELITKVREIAERLGVLNAVQDQDGIYDFSWEDNPPEVQPLLKFKESGILYPEGLSLLTGPSGKGKSQIIHAIAAGAFNPNCDTLGFSGMAAPILLIDTENPLSIFRKNVRRGLETRAGLPEGTKINGIVDYRNIRGIDTFEKRQDFLFKTMEKGIYKLYLIDGAGDFVLDVNDVESSIRFVSKLCAMTLKFKCGVLVTLHGNPGTLSEKARGHLGSELIRKADCSILLKADSDIRCITTEYSLGKNRADNDSLTQYFTWDSFHGMHVSCNPPEKSASKNVTQSEREKFVTTMGLRKYSYSELKLAIMNIKDKNEKGKSDKTAERWIKDLQNLNMIIQDDAGFYVANPNHISESGEE